MVNRHWVFTLVVLWMGAGALSAAEKYDAGVDRIRQVRLADGEVTRVWTTNGETIVDFVLRPTSASYIRNRLWLASPEVWDERFWGVGNGGWAGHIWDISADGSARLSCDLGTSRTTRNDAPEDPEVIRDYSWRATHLATVAAKRLVESYYGRKPKRCYFTGASCGGRQGLMEAIRYPKDYDGIISEVPGFVERSRAAHAWQRERLERKYGQWFTPEERAVIRAAELRYFATRDPEFACGKFILDPYPTPEKLAGCWREIVAAKPSLKNREALWRELFDPVKVGGRDFVPGRVLGIEFDSVWGFMLPKMVGGRTAATATEADLLAVFETSPEFKVSPDLSAFKASGGKLIMYGGMEDLSCAETEMRAYYDSVLRTMGGAERVQDFFLYFSEPGRTHGARGEAAGTGKIGKAVRLEEQLIDWVEKGLQPECLTFKWTSEPKLLKVTPYPENAVSCEPEPVSAKPFSTTAKVSAVGEVSVVCADAGEWRFEVSSESMNERVGVIKLKLHADRPTVPPALDVKWAFSQKDVHHFWTSESTHYGIPWDKPVKSEISSWLPLYSFLDAKDANRLTVAASESCRTVTFISPINEKKMHFDCTLRYFTVPEAPLTDYETCIRFDTRDAFYGQTIGESSDWMCRAAGIEPMSVPESAFEPLYSTWYTFHQEVSAGFVEAECRDAAALGMKTVIVDDGWQIDQPIGQRTEIGYMFCGDWEAGRNFPDMAAHVKRVQALGFKYLLWYSVPFVGEKSANFARFKGKFLPIENCCGGGWTLDPRFPEVREFLISTYERAVRDWNIDGFKLDFIGRFKLRGPDPALKDGYAGRDMKSIPLATERLLTDVMKRLRAIKPDVLIEFRQPYLGPCIRRFGNMIRATDCPLSMVENRTRIARLRLTSGGTAVHSDMLEWRRDESAQSAARAVLNAIFGVVQYSVRLQDCPKDHLDMIRHWIAFSRAHRGALLKGEFRPHYPAQDYPLLEGEDAAERVIGVYQDGLVVPIAADKPTYVLNAANAPALTIDFATAPKRVETYDTFGRKVAEVKVPAAGVRSTSVPLAGYVKIW